MARARLVIEHPNRDRPESRTTRAIVVSLLLISAVLLAIVTVGGWEKIQGAKPIQLAYIVVYALLAFHIARWRSGLLAVAAAFAIILLIFCGDQRAAVVRARQGGLRRPAAGRGASSAC